ncbi:MAG: ATP-binding protein [Saprospiraceae bacterium]|nr:ATP-binding protein [Saprospiraceae bacterium]
MELNRALIHHLKNTAKYYPVISLVGPRQAGKSTIKNGFSGYKYLSMEDPDILNIAKLDPRGFFETYNDGVIIDEAQKMPELFSYLQGIVDKDRTPGRYVLSGSHNYLMHRHISQSLAGRVDLSTLFPLDFEELEPVKSDQELEDMMLQGFYPGKVVNEIPSKIFYRNYIRTYLERDVSDLINIGSLSVFRTFLKLLAHHVGGQLNLAHFSNQLNVAANTVKAWLSILQSSYIIFLLPAYHKNFGKRLIKSPKIYFYDIGLLCHLLDIHDKEALKGSSKFGVLFENFVIAEKKKFNAHRHQEIEMFFFRDSNGLEVDLLETISYDEVRMSELKSGLTFKTEFLTNMNKLKLADKTLNMNIIYTGAETLKLTDVNIIRWRDIHRFDHSKTIA